MAVKMYGWYHVNNWRGGQTSEGCYDVDSLPYNYQVWDPAIGAPDTDAAVRDTWDYYLVYASSGTPYSTNFGSGTTGDACGDLDGQSPPWMSQWGTVTCANQSKPWYDILLNRYYTSGNGSPASTLVHGPFATASGAEGLTGLSPYITPSSNSQVTVHWTGTSGIDYELCFDGTLTGEFDIYCEYLGNGIGSWTQATPAGDQSYLYVRLLACQSGYCSAIRAGGIENRSLNGNNFYGTASYIWPYSTVYVGERNYSSLGSGAELWDGVPGFGGTRQVVCNVFPSPDCGPDSWVASSLSWYVTVTQSIENPADTAPIRVVPDSVGE